MAYDVTEERLKVRGSEQITRDLKVNRDAFINGDLDTKNIKIEDDLSVGGEAVFADDVAVHGDLYVTGTTTTTSEAQVSSSGNYIVTRDNNNSPMGIGQYSGLAVNNYATGKIATITSDHEGTWRISDSATSTAVTFTNISAYNGVYYSGISQTTTTGPSGILTDVDADELASVVLNGTDYYHHSGNDWFGPITLVNNSLNSGSIVTDATLIATLNSLTKNDLVYYRSVISKSIDASTNQPLLTRDESSNLANNHALKWDSTNEKAVDSGVSITTASNITNVTADNFVGHLTGNADTATCATNASEAAHAVNADCATNATNAAEATHAVNADCATNATNATNATCATHATTADCATNATNAACATEATHAACATYADCTGNVAYATCAGTAAYLTAPSTAGIYTDCNGNFVHKSANCNEYWHVDNNAGSPVFTVYFEEGYVAAACLCGNASSATNADTVDGLHACYVNAANTVVARDSNGYICATHYNMDVIDQDSFFSSSSRLVYANSDNWFRYVTWGTATNTMKSCIAQGMDFNADANIGFSNTHYGCHFYVLGNPDCYCGNTHTFSSIGATNGNLHLDAEYSPNDTHGTYINYFAGSGTYFGNGSNSIVACIDKNGNATFCGNISAANFCGTSTCAIQLSSVICCPICTERAPSDCYSAREIVNVGWVCVNTAEKSFNVYMCLPQQCEEPTGCYYCYWCFPECALYSLLYSLTCTGYWTVPSMPIVGTCNNILTTTIYYYPSCGVSQSCTCYIGASGYGVNQQMYGQHGMADCWLVPGERYHFVGYYI